jgi:hypothetical protein
VAENMVHGPRGIYNPKSSCMKNEKCSKIYPKEFHETTTINENGFVVYKRPNNQRFVIKGGAKMDNRWIVPHNIELLKNMLHTLTQSDVTKASLSNTYLNM